VISREACADAQGVLLSSASLESVPVGVGARRTPAVKQKGPGKAPAPVLRDVLLYVRRLAPVRATVWMRLHPFHPRPFDPYV